MNIYIQHFRDRSESRLLINIKEADYKSNYPYKLYYATVLKNTMKLTCKKWMTLKNI